AVFLLPRIQDIPPNLRCGRPQEDRTTDPPTTIVGTRRVPASSYSTLRIQSAPLRTSPCVEPQEDRTIHKEPPTCLASRSPRPSVREASTRPSGGKDAAGAGKASA